MTTTGTTIAITTEGGNDRKKTEYIAAGEACKAAVF